MALKRSVREFCEHCGERQVFKFHADGSPANYIAGCKCVPGPPNPPRSFAPGEVLLETPCRNNESNSSNA